MLDVHGTVAFRNNW